MTPPDDNDPTRSRPVSDDGSTRPFGPPAPPPPDEPPPDGGRYRVLTQYPPKKGGQGRVYRATDTELRRVVALKDIQPRYADDATFRAQFVAEAELTGRLEHPGIVPVYGLGFDPAGRPHYAMQHVAGESLGEVVRRFHTDGPTGRDRAVALRQLLGRFLAVCQAVAFAHSKGVLHADLKPGNVMVGRYGETLVVDWGMAKLIGSGEWGGTPEYWAPEQARQGTTRLDERTDVYGLGAVLFAILTGHPPHPLRVHPPYAPSPRAFAPDVDEVLDQITRRALAPDPADRHPTATALADAVEEWLTDQPVVAQRQLVAGLGRQVDAGADGLGERLARERWHLGLMLAGMGRDDEAADLFRRAAEGYERLTAARTEPRLQADRANCLLSAARSFERLNRDALADSCRRQATELLRHIIATSPNEFEVAEASLLITHYGLTVAPPPATTDGEGKRAAAEEQQGGVEPPAAGEDESALADRSGEPLTVDPPPGERTTDTAEPRLPDLPGGPAGGFTPLREIGRGGMASVFLATDNRLGRQVAIKVLPAGRSDNPVLRRVAEQEIRLTAALEHPNVVRVYAAGERADGSPFMVMEYLDGVNLREWMRDTGPGPTADREAPPIFAQVCDALHHAHARGIIHRDPKPSNVMLVDGGRAVLFDWGLAQRLADRADGEPSQPSGTPVYMAPEQLTGERIGPATDTFVVGAGLFEALAGRRAVSGSGLGDVVEQLRRGQLPRLREVRPDAPAELDRIVGRAMAFRPEDRYPSAAALAADLRAFVARQS